MPWPYSLPFTAMDLFVFFSVRLYLAINIPKIMALRSAGTGDRLPVNVVQTLALKR
jgi:hypothetical protein